MTAPSSPLLRYLGSKWRLAPEIVRRLPPHSLYIEPFGGSAAVLAHKPRCNSEIWNDLDGEVVNLFQVLRSPAAPRLLDLVALTPYAREEFALSYEPTDDPVERARRLLTRSHMGHGNSGTRITHRTGWRVAGVRKRNNVARQWALFPEALSRWIARFNGVYLEKRPALDLLAKFDAPQALFYLDPPYLLSTRSASVRLGSGKCAYAHEMSSANHAELLERVAKSRAMIVLSGYPHGSYDAALEGWHRVELRSHSHDNLPRTEVLWINPAAANAGGLFAEAAA